jgi:hypothetical protein
MRKGLIEMFGFEAGFRWNHGPEADNPTTAMDSMEVGKR